MELARTKNWFYALLAAAVGFIFFLGAWWLYLVFKLAGAVEGSHKDAIPSNLALMVKWEGVSFFLLIIALALALFYVFWQDHKKTKSLQTFYATLTHELKTPLASMRLQSEVLSEFIEALSIGQQEKEKLGRYSSRLQEDVGRLENELDKHLQLSRLEGGGNLSFTPIAVIPLIKSMAKKFPQIDLRVDSKLENPTIVGDQTALGIIFKNLFENTLRHGKTDEKQANVSIYSEDGNIVVLYDDHGERFLGNTKDLGKLFYKHDSPKGSGIGLYLIKKLAGRQGGKLSIRNEKSLRFELRFKEGESLE